MGPQGPQGTPGTPGGATGAGGAGGAGGTRQARQGQRGQRAPPARPGRPGATGTTGATGAQGPAGTSGSTVGYTATGSAISGFHAVSVTAKAANISIKLTGPALFASATSYVCFGSDVTPKHTGAVVTFTYSQRFAVSVHAQR